MVNYTLEDVIRIKDELKDYSLNEDVTKVLKRLTELLGVDTYQKSRYNKKDKSQNNEDIAWKKQQMFKKTVFVKKSIIDEKFDILRGMLNKLSQKNFEDQKEKILLSIKDIYDHVNDADNEESPALTKEEMTEKIIDLLFLVIINNRFFVNLYADLYILIVENHMQYDEYIIKFLQKYDKLVDEIEYCDPDVDYDKYCVINKKNEERKSLLSFLIHCVERDLCSFNDVYDIVNNRIFVQFEKNIEDESTTAINEEIIENMSVFITVGKELINKNVIKYSITEQITKYSKMKGTEKPGFSNRIRFKCMDLVEELKK